MHHTRRLAASTSVSNTNHRSSPLSRYHLRRRVARRSASRLQQLPPLQEASEAKSETNIFIFARELPFPPKLQTPIDPPPRKEPIPIVKGVRSRLTQTGAGDFDGQLKAQSLQYPLTLTKSLSRRGGGAYSTRKGQCQPDPVVCATTSTSNCVCEPTHRCRLHLNEPKSIANCDRPAPNVPDKRPRIVQSHET